MFDPNAKYIHHCNNGPLWFKDEDFQQVFGATFEKYL